MSDWIPEGLRDAPYFKATEDGVERTVEQVLADLTNAAKLQGDLTTSHIRIPDRDDPDSVRTAMVKVMEHVPGLTAIPDGTDPDQQEAFFKSIGRPDEAGQYTVPEGVSDTLDLNGVREQALADGWTQAQFTNYVTRLVQSNNTNTEAMQAQIDTNLATMKTEWGAAYGDRVEQVKSFLSTDGVPESLATAFTEGRMGVAEMKWLHGMAQAVAGEDMQLSGQISASDNISPAEASEALMEIEKTLYSMKSTDPNYAGQIAKQERYLRAMRGEAQH